MKKKIGKTGITDDKAKADDKEQSQRFIEAAKVLKADETGGKFKEALTKIKPKES